MGERKSAAAPLTIAVLAILFPLAYFFSIGPLVLFIESDYIDEDHPMVQGYAWPIAQVCTHNSVCNHVVCSYALLWAPEESAYKYTPNE